MTSPLLGALIALLVGLMAVGLVMMQAVPETFAQAAVNGNCTLIVPPNPLSAQGLATPYQLVATDPAMGPCHEANAMQGAFVQGAVITPWNGQISIYNPLVIDKGTKPAIAPVVPDLPKGAIVALWFGFNGMNLTLQGQQNSLRDGNCVNGLGNSVFGQFAYCNAPAFFRAANWAIKEGKLAPPPLGRARDGQTCPSVRDFSVVDQDQSDNVTTTYLINGAGQTAQATAANIAKLGGSTAQTSGNVARLQTNGALTNASDNRLLAVAIDGALGCTPWMVEDLANPGHKTTALPLDELQAAVYQGPPVALVPSRDPMVLVNNAVSLTKINLYRIGVDQPLAQNLWDASTVKYCQNLLDIAPPRLLRDSVFTRVQPSPDAAAANNLFTFLAQRFNTTWGANGLNCQGLLGIPSPIKVTVNGNGVAVAATIMVMGRG